MLSRRRPQELLGGGGGGGGAPGRASRLRAQQQQQPLKGRRPGWHPRRRGRTPGCFSSSSSSSGPHSRQHYRPQEAPAPLSWGGGWCCRAGGRARVLLSLRAGKRAPGMRAPRNTNQFLMGEKYRLMHLRSDSLGGEESGGEESEEEEAAGPLGVEPWSLLGALEEARGALPDSPAGSPPPAPDRPLRGWGGCSAGTAQEESLQYFPSDDDVLQSQLFMERDFHQFYSSVAL